MTDKVQKIKDWISKEQDGLMDANGNFEYPEYEGAYNILCNLDAYIDSLQEEPKFKVGQYLKQGDTIVKILEVSDDGYHCDNAFIPLSAQDQWELVKEPVSRTPADIEAAMQEVEEKSKAFTEAHQGENTDTILAQMRGEERVSNDLKEAADNALSNVLNTHEIVNVRSCLEMFRFGAKWQKEHLWKPADGDDLPEIDKEVIVLVGIKKPVTTDSVWGCEVAFAHRPNPNGWDGKSITTGKVEHYDVQTYGKGGWNIPDVKFWLDCELPKMKE